LSICELEELLCGLAVVVVGAAVVVVVVVVVGAAVVVVVGSAVVVVVVVVGSAVVVVGSAGDKDVEKNIILKDESNLAPFLIFSAKHLIYTTC
jgi:hypothetical protein